MLPKIDLNIQIFLNHFFHQNCEIISKNKQEKKNKYLSDDFRFILVENFKVDRSIYQENEKI